MGTDAVAIIGFLVLFVLMLLRVPVGMAMGLVGGRGQVLDGERWEPRVRAGRHAAASLASIPSASARRFTWALLFSLYAARAARSPPR